MLKKALLYILVFMPVMATTQDHEPVNGVYSKDKNHYILYNATIHLNAEETIQNGYLEIKSGRIVRVSSINKFVKGAVKINLNNKHIYPSFIDLYSTYGLSADKKTITSAQNPQLKTSKKGPFSWNEALRPEYNSVNDFNVDELTAKVLIDQGFGTVLSHRKNGIARGTGLLVSLLNQIHKAVLSDKAASFYSFSKGTSRQSYPSSLMGSIALLRQAFYDRNWYDNIQNPGFTDLSLQAMLNNRKLVQIFDVGNYLNIARAHNIAKEFEHEFIYKCREDAYKSVRHIADKNLKLVLPVHVPKAINPTDPYETMLVPLSVLKHWEMAKANAAIFENAGVSFALTADGLKNKKHFLQHLKQAIKHGLSESQALKSLTSVPAAFLGMEDQLGSLHKGKLANFIISSGPLFDSSTIIYDNWIQGVKHIVNEEKTFDVRGEYDIKIANKLFKLIVAGKPGKFKSKIVLDTTKINTEVQVDRKLISIAFAPNDSSSGAYRLSGKIHFDSGLWEGKGTDPDGNWISWSAIRSKKFTPPKSQAEKDSVEFKHQWVPATAYGYDSIPKQRTILIKNATVWTNESLGILKNTSVLIRDGKIIEVGEAILDAGDPETLIIDASGKHVTCGIIDEHSHIAIEGGVNESGQAISAEVRISDVINPNDINIYRQLAGGVTTSQLLHGSANPIGGQSAIIKLKWGNDAAGLLIKNMSKFIKFALGENVKQSNWGDHNTIRFPQTRMGVEQIFYDAFFRAKEYETSWAGFQKKSNKKKEKDTVYPPRKDLELEAIVEILNQTRFITCHSYVQSEINMLMHVADSMGFVLNTFTHILEGYKIADKMKLHGAGASTFSDWWAYKYEVKDAIPYNAAILNQMGIVTAINSDDAEMGRRLNQEAAKAVKYGGMSEEEAWKMVTLNPAKLLHLDDRMGSIKPGKDADIVIWNDNPLSIYSVVEKTIIDGAVYYDQEQNKQLIKRNRMERERLLNEMRKAIARGEPVRKAIPDKKALYNCFKAAQP